MGGALRIIAEGRDRLEGSRTCGFLLPAPGLQFQILEKINPLQTTLILKRGIVSSRVALSLRSVEIKPLFSRFVPFLTKREHLAGVGCRVFVGGGGGHDAGANSDEMQDSAKTCGAGNAHGQLG